MRLRLTGKLHTNIATEQIKEILFSLRDVHGFNVKKNNIISVLACLITCVLHWDVEN